MKDLSEIRTSWEGLKRRVFNIGMEKERSKHCCLRWHGASELLAMAVVVKYAVSYVFKNLETKKLAKFLNLWENALCSEIFCILIILIELRYHSEPDRKKVLGRKKLDKI